VPPEAPFLFSVAALGASVAGLAGLVAPLTVATLPLLLLLIVVLARPMLAFLLVLGSLETIDS
jgi:hypothetical protein